MEILISIIFTIQFLWLLGNTARIDSFIKQQMTINNEILKAMQAQNVAVNFLNQRLLKAGTEIIELNAAITPPDKGSLN